MHYGVIHACCSAFRSSPPRETEFSGCTFSFLGKACKLTTQVLREFDGACAVHMPPIEGRLIQTWMYNRSHPDDNHYAHPIDFVPLVDLNLRKARALALLSFFVAHCSIVASQFGFADGSLHPLAMMVTVFAVQLASIAACVKR